MAQVPVRLDQRRMEKLRRLARENERTIAAQARHYMNQVIDEAEVTA